MNRKKQNWLWALPVAVPSSMIAQIDIHLFRRYYKLSKTTTRDPGDSQILSCRLIGCRRFSGIFKNNIMNDGMDKYIKKGVY